MLKAKQYCYIPWTSLWLTFSNFFYKCLSMLFQTLFPNYEDKVVKKVDLTNWQCQRTEEARREVLATSRGERQARPSPTLAPPFVLHCIALKICNEQQNAHHQNTWLSNAHLSNLGFFSRQFFTLIPLPLKSSLVIQSLSL